MDITIILLIILALGTIILVVWNIRTEQRLKKFWEGSNASNLENYMTNLVEEVQVLESKLKNTESRVADLEKKMKQTLRGADLLRFNPFKDAGSNQSFALALMNEEDNGLILSSLYSRDRMSVFAKEIKNGTPVQEISEEESAVLVNARKKARA